jgi:hypothetical protein
VTHGLGKCPMKLEFCVRRRISVPNRGWYSDVAEKKRKQLEG